MELVKSWIMTIDQEGWIPPEQARGAEARSLIPPEFQAVPVGAIVPPSLVMPLSILLEKSSEKVLKLLSSTFSRWNLYFDFLEGKLENSGLPCTF